MMPYPYGLTVTLIDPELSESLADIWEGTCVDYPSGEYTVDDFLTDRRMIYENDGYGRICHISGPDDCSAWAWFQEIGYYEKDEDSRDPIDIIWDAYIEVDFNPQFHPGDRIAIKTSCRSFYSLSSMQSREIEPPILEPGEYKVIDVGMFYDGELEDAIIGWGFDFTPNPDDKYIIYQLEDGAGEQRWVLDQFLEGAL